MRTIIISSWIALLLNGCVSLDSGSTSSFVAQETVLSQGIKICAEDKGSNICIVAGKNNERTISLDGKTQSINLVAREKRWHGKLGLLSPGHPGDLWKDDDGVTMATIQESQIHYKSIEAVEKSLLNPFKKEWGGHIVYNDEGLLLQWKKTQMSERQSILDLSIFQILINGEKPKKLTGSNNSQIW
ncbi:MAG: hypothetical protein HF981_25325 [Desulfobacteraceae bacterium]|nr:hypothetical protein [Desulfobacteraceae bacterium]MBC2753739.1 hypothetical protein [Desulfobacteraceae bacterium]